MIYNKWGFVASPFQHEALPASGIGTQLLLGRDPEIARLRQLIENGPKLAAIEGVNGVGKTSISNVTAFELYQAHIHGKNKSLYIPCDETFQLLPNTNCDDFVVHLLRKAVQTLILRKSDLLKTIPKDRTDQLNRYLNEIETSSHSLGLSAFGFGLQGSLNRNLNSSEGFQNSGFKLNALAVLREAFPAEQGGGIICVIDNLELLKDSDKARELIEALRDELFHTQGLTFILSGSQGIVKSLFSSRRLSGYLHEPVFVSKLDEYVAREIFESRVTFFKSESVRNPYLPLEIDDFCNLFNILKGNLRDTLSHADDYCQWVVANDYSPVSPLRKSGLFMDWIDETGSKCLRKVQPAFFKNQFLKDVFLLATEYDELAPQDFEEIAAEGVTPLVTFRESLLMLTKLGLIESTIDPTDPEKTVVHFTPDGCFVSHRLTTTADG